MATPSFRASSVLGNIPARLMKALDVPVHNCWGLRPALVKGTKDIAPLTTFRDIDELGLLRNVSTLNFHPHLPHYEITEQNGEVRSIYWRASRSIASGRIPSPQLATRNLTACSGCRQMSSAAGDIVLVDSTNFTTLFGGTESLENFWRNLALMK